MAEDKNKQLFLSLIYSFQMQSMMQLGKLTNPMTNKSERELDAAQMTIDMLDMLKDKTKNNIGDEESRFLTQVIADLKLNYVEERDKDQKATLKVEDSKDESKKVENKPEENEKQEKKTKESTKEEAKKADGKREAVKKEEVSNETSKKESGKKEPEADKEDQGQSNTKDEGSK